MLSPSHVQVLVKRAQGLKIKGKNGTNDAYVSIELGKDKFQTGVKEKCENPSWNEECVMSLPTGDTRTEILVKVLHRNFMGADDFLGQACLDLKDFDVYEKPKTSWYPLMCKPGKNKSGYRGEIELKIGFSVNNSAASSFASAVSHTNTLTSSEKSSRRKSRIVISDESDDGNDDPGVVSEIEDDGLLDEFGTVTPVDTPTHSTEDILDMFDHTGSLNAGPRYTLDDVVDTVDSDIDLDLDLDHHSGTDSESDPVATDQLQQYQDHLDQQYQDQEYQEHDHHQYQEHDELEYHDLQHQDHPQKLLPEHAEQDAQDCYIESPQKLSLSSSNEDLPIRSNKIMNKHRFNDDDEGYFSRKVSVESTQSTASTTSDDSRSSTSSNMSGESEQSGPPNGDRVVLGRDASPDPDISASPQLSSDDCTTANLPDEILQKFRGQSREDLIEMVCFLQRTVECQGKKLADLEDYIDSMVLRVMEKAPVILENNMEIYYSLYKHQ